MFCVIVKVLLFTLFHSSLEFSQLWFDLQALTSCVCVICIMVIIHGAEQRRVHLTPAAGLCQTKFVYIFATPLRGQCAVGISHS